MGPELKKLIEGIDAQSAMGQQESPDVMSEQQIYNPKYIEAIQAKQQQAAPIGAKEAQQASDISKVGGLATAAGAASANPVLLAAAAKAYVDVQVLKNEVVAYREDIREIKLDIREIRNVLTNKEK